MDPKLFTPGPLTTSRTVKEAMLRDLGSRESEFIEIVAEVRSELLKLAGANPAAETHDCVIIQGSGTFGIESLISSAVPADGHILVLNNGVYGTRIETIAKIYGIPVTPLRTALDIPPTAEAVSQVLSADRSITHVAAVHCETTSGILNPVEEIGAAVRAAGRTYLIDAMSSFGGIPLTFEGSDADAIVSSSNKCIEGVPGFSFVLAKHDFLLDCAGSARTLSLDLHAQWAGLEKNGQFRFTPPTHVILAFAQALRELSAEGGVASRTKRYAENQRRIVEGMRALRFRTVLDREVQSPIITSFHQPNDPNYDFETFHDALARRGSAIYPGKLADIDAFRIGSVGQIHSADVDALLSAVAEAIEELGITV